MPSPMSSFRLFRRRDAACHLLEASCFHYRRQLLCTANPPSPLLHTLAHPIYSIWGSNTDVGKTLVSTGLAASVLSLQQAADQCAKFVYIKPIQTGFPTNSDSRFVFQKIRELFHYYKTQFPIVTSNHVLTASAVAASAVRERSHAGFSGTNSTCSQNLQWYEEIKLQTGDISSPQLFSSELICKTICGWREPASPHLVAEKEGCCLDDSSLFQTLQKCLTIGLDDANDYKRVFTVLETAGGVASPGPVGTLQCDLYRPFRFPGILVGDGQLGGISATLSSYEFLNARGYDIISIVLVDHGMMNEKFLSSYLQKRIPVLLLPNVPSDESDNLLDWFDGSRDVFYKLQEIMLSYYFQRVQKFRGIKKQATEIFWWPFTQHKFVPEEKVTAIDSRSGGNFVVYNRDQSSESLSLQFDACASWWTQGPDTSLQVELARKMAYATGRYGHVMFPENVNEPALECAQLLLQGVGKGWASRVYYSDNGSTAIEIALKMAFRKFSIDHEIIPKDFTLNLPLKEVELKVLSFKGCYHGDTLGAMEAQAPSSYTGFFQHPWYRGRGLYLDPPTISLKNGEWTLSLPEALQHLSFVDEAGFNSRDSVFDKNRDESNLAKIYSSYVSRQLMPFSESQNDCFIGALLLEPVILAAGGMIMVDPLFQRVVVGECRHRKIPVIFDEVFTGFWRLGVESAAELLHCHPDIACYAKLMTGGVVPLAVTLSTSAVFDSFIGDSKVDGLLHGHSYSAHPVGCMAAVTSIKWFKEPSTNPNLLVEETTRLRELWDADLVRSLSSHPAVKRVAVLGTLFAFDLLADDSLSGYASVYGSSIIGMLRKMGVYTRPLGNVIYMMCGPCTAPHVCTQLLKKVLHTLDHFSQHRH